MTRLKNVTGLVTGGASGLGKAIAQRLAADGARVIISDVQGDLGRETAAQGSFTFLEQNVCDEEQWRQVISEIETRFGQLNVLVNSAGIAGPMDASTPENTRLEDWRKIFAVNTEGVFLGCRAAIPAMRRAGGGSIVNISSIGGILANSSATAYGASKAAVGHLTQSVAQYCAQERLNIRCNSVHPGAVLTPLLRDVVSGIARSRGLTSEAVVEEIKSTVPGGELVLPEDVAAAVAFLVSADSRQINGEKMIVDGGRVTCSGSFRGNVSVVGGGAISGSENCG
ncbi:SDR family NAD(P)-dependent oxidoreductase [Steroidobacter flavus]|uniref:SDR family NAD(P)-dependent oxidoreductase n=1 Tax=Steroidobacter flavus TaxID=1842136 RepID=A0ABV8SVN8_9GAMM